MNCKLEEFPVLFTADTSNFIPAGVDETVTVDVTTSGR